jgi:hypothetical protein
MPGKAAQVLARSVLFTCVALLFAEFAGSSASAYDRGKFCDKAGANVVLYLDVTTPYDDTDRKALTDGIARIFTGLSGGERIAIRTIEDGFSSSRRILDACVPYCPGGGVISDLFSDCTEGMLINERKALRRMIVESVSEHLTEARELPYSEIVRTLCQTFREEYRKDRRNRIFIFSDMIENSPYIPGAEFFSRTDAALIAKLEGDSLIPDIWEAEVHVFGFGRTGNPADRKPLPQDKFRRLEGFWTKFFAAGGASADLKQNLTVAE